MSREEFLRETGLTFKPVCADRTFTYACFECVSDNQPGDVRSPGVLSADPGVLTQTIAMMLGAAV
jgi:hypothetical protein